MKKLLLPLAFAGAMVLGGCQTDVSKTAQDIATSISTGSQTFNEKVASVKSYATKVCQYVPTAASVIAIFNSGFGTDVAAVANAICQAVTTAPLADGPGDHKPRVNGVVVHGRFVK
jgi:hypothetical protein